MLKDWSASAGYYHSGARVGEPKRLEHIQRGGLCVLTTRDPDTKEEDRYIFALFLIGNSYEGDDDNSGEVIAMPEYKMAFTPKEARSLLYWDYYSNASAPNSIKWGTHLHRYLNDVQSVQILKAAVDVKKGTKDQTLAEEILEHYCQLSEIDESRIPKPEGALKRGHVK
jgi:hypothetical protein